MTITTSMSRLHHHLKAGQHYEFLHGLELFVHVPRIRLGPIEFDHSPYLVVEEPTTINKS